MWTNITQVCGRSPETGCLYDVFADPTGARRAQFSPFDFLERTLVFVFAVWTLGSCLVRPVQSNTTSRASSRQCTMQCMQRSSSSTRRSIRPSAARTTGQLAKRLPACTGASGAQLENTHTVRLLLWLCFHSHRDWCTALFGTLQGSILVLG